MWAAEATVELLDVFADADLPPVPPASLSGLCCTAAVIYGPVVNIAARAFRPGAQKETIQESARPWPLNSQDAEAVHPVCLCSTALFAALSAVAQLPTPASEER